MVSRAPFVSSRTAHLLVALALATPALGALAGCGGASDTARKPRYVFVTNTQSSFWEPMKAGIKKAAAEWGFAVEHAAPRASSSEEQISIVESLIARGVDGICISPISEQALVPVLKRAQDRGIAVMCMDSDAPATGRAVYMGTFNYQAGRRAGEALKEALPAGGKVAAFVGSMSASNSQERWRGVRDAVEGTAIRFVGDPDQDQDNQDKAQNNVRDQLAHHADLAGIVGIWAYNGPAAARAVRQAGKVEQVRIIAFDDDPQTLQFLADGVIAAAVAQRPWRWGYEGTRILHRVRTEGREATLADLRAKGLADAQGAIDTGVEVITKANVAQYREAQKKLGQ